METAIVKLVFVIIAAFTVAGATEDSEGYERIEFEADPPTQQQDAPEGDAAEHLRKLSTLNAYPQALAARPAIPTARHSKYYVGKVGGVCE